MEMGSELVSEGYPVFAELDACLTSVPKRKDNVVPVATESTVSEKNDYVTVVRGALRTVGVGSLSGETCVRDNKVLMSGTVRGVGTKHEQC